MSALIRQLALVSESSQVDMSQLMQVSAALQKQASRDLSPIWEISATVDPFAKLEDIPDGYLPLIIQDDIGFSGAAGIHLDKDGQPYALITASSDMDTWSLTASHEMCEMLVDPSGNRQVTGDSPKPGQGRVSFIVEVSDPSEAADYAYSVNGVLVSDFYTPQFFDPMAASGVRYSFTGAITAPRTILRGGYLSWMEPQSGHLWQTNWFDGGAPSFHDLGPVNLSSSNGSMRAYVDAQTEKFRAKAIARGRVAAHMAGNPLSVAKKSSAANAARWRDEIDKLVGRKRRGAAKTARRARKTRR